MRSPLAVAAIVLLSLPLATADHEPCTPEEVQADPAACAPHAPPGPDPDALVAQVTALVGDAQAIAGDVAEQVGDALGDPVAQVGAARDAVLAVADAEGAKEFAEGRARMACNPAMDAPANAAPVRAAHEEAREHLTPTQQDDVDDVVWHAQHLSRDCRRQVVPGAFAVLP